MRLPAVTPQKLVRALKKIGFEEKRQTGGHLILVHRERGSIIPIPMHRKDIKRGLLARVIKQTRIPLDEFISLL